jgi:hypothetical protein
VKKLLMGFVVILAATVAFLPGAMADQTHPAPVDPSHGPVSAPAAAARAGAAESASIARAAPANAAVGVPGEGTAGHVFTASEVQAAVQAGGTAALDAQAASAASAARAASAAEDAATRAEHHEFEKDALIASPFLIFLCIGVLSVCLIFSGLASAR